MSDEWTYEGDRKREQVAVDGSRSRYPAERMMVRLSGRVSANVGGTAGMFDPVPWEVKFPWGSFFIFRKE